MDLDPHEAIDNSDVFSARLEADVARLCELVGRGIEIDGEVRSEGDRWIIFGRAGYDGELILAEYDNEREASTVLRSVPR